MSRFYYDDRGTWVRRSHVKSYTPAWAAARAERAARRRAEGVTEQQRDAQGFIMKLVDGRVLPVDPGIIDRALWTETSG